MGTARGAAAALSVVAVVATAAAATVAPAGAPGTFRASLPVNLCTVIGSDAVRELIPTTTGSVGRGRGTPYGPAVSCVASGPGWGAPEVVVTLGRYASRPGGAEPVFRDLVARLARRDAPVGQRTDSDWVPGLGDVARRREQLVGDHGMTRLDLVVLRGWDVVTVEFTAERAPRAYVRVAAARVAQRALG